MSTKIYDGKRLSDMSVRELHQFCQKLKADLLPIARTEYIKLIATIAQSAYMYTLMGQNICKYSVDITKLGSHDEGFSPYEVFLFAKEQADKLVTNTSNAIRRMDSESDADFDVSICVFPIHDKILCIPYANHDIIHEALFNIESFAEYGYWNNTDRPDSVSEDEWNQRKEDWDKALPGIGIPRDNGMLFKIIDAPYDIVQKEYVSIDQILPYFVSNDELRKEFAKSSILEREFQRFVKEFGGDWIRNGYKCLRKAQEYVDNHEDEIQKIAESMRDNVKCVEFFQKHNE